MFIVLTILGLIAASVLAVMLIASRMAPADKRADLDVEAGSGRPPGRSRSGRRSDPLSGSRAHRASKDKR